jgi:hypothetical protein
LVEEVVEIVFRLRKEGEIDSRESRKKYLLFFGKDEKISYL